MNCIFRHCVSINEEDGYVFPARFTQKQLSYFQTLGEGLFFSASSTSGVEIELILEKDTVEFDFHADRYKRDFLVFDIYENNLLGQRIRIDGRQEAGHISYRKKDPGKAHIRICLPYSCRCGIKNLDICHPVERNDTDSKTYLALGDSITLGSDANSASENYVRILADYFDAEYRNCGIGGYWFDAESLDKDYPFQPDIITVAYGTNDPGRHTDDEISQHIELFFSKLKQIFPASHIYVISPIWRGDINNNDRVNSAFANISTQLKDIAARNRMVFIDGMSIFPHLPCMFEDKKLHPTSEGFWIYAHNLIRIIKRYENNYPGT